METIAPFLHGITFCFNIFSILVLVWGAVVSAKDFFITRIYTRDRAKSAKRLVHIKNQMGTYVLFSLEMLIAADIIDTIRKPSIEDILRLAAIVAIRTVISFFLNKEIRESGDEA